MNDPPFTGFDVWAWKRRGIPGIDLLKPKPEWGLGYATPYHYPRNPCGSGFLLDLDRESFTGLSLDPVEVPTGCSIYPKEIFRTSKRWAEKRFRRLVHFRELPRGGHFAAFEQPETFVREVRETFRGLR